MTRFQIVDGELRELSDEEHIAQILAEAAAHGIDLCPRCFFGNLVNGVCEMCARQDVFNADPEYRAWSDAQARLDFGGWAPDSTRPYTYDDGQADEAVVKRLEAKFATAERDAKVEPDACRFCGVPSRSHGQRFGGGHGGDGLMTYVAPTNAQRKARMIARRNVRLGLLVWAPLNLGYAA